MVMEPGDSVQRREGVGADERGDASADQWVVAFDFDVQALEEDFS